jgi:xanthine/CO dehydrogenase XdhC/CoxF family maturation factor
MDERVTLIPKEDFESKVLKKAAESLNFIGLLASAYRAPELLDFLEQLSRGLERFGKLRSPKRPTSSL